MSGAAPFRCGETCPLDWTRDAASFRRCPPGTLTLAGLLAAPHPRAMPNPQPWQQKERRHGSSVPSWPRSSMVSKLGRFQMHQRAWHLTAVSRKTRETSVSARSRRSGSRDVADRECRATLTPDTRAGIARDAAIPVRRVRRNLQALGEHRET